MKTGGKGVQKGVHEYGFKVHANDEKQMKRSNKLQHVGDPDDFDEGTYRLAVCNECFAISNKVVRTKTYERALAAGGAKCQAK